MDPPEPAGGELVDDPAMVLLVVLLEPGSVDVGEAVVVVVGAVVVVVGAVVVVVGAVVVVVGAAMTAETTTASTYRYPLSAPPDTRIRTIVLVPVWEEMSNEALAAFCGPPRSIEPNVAQEAPPFPDTWIEAVPTGLPWNCRLYWKDRVAEVAPARSASRDAPWFARSPPSTPIRRQFPEPPEQRSLATTWTSPEVGPSDSATSRQGPLQARDPSLPEYEMEANSSLNDSGD